MALDLLPKYRSSSEGVVVNIASIAGLLNFGAAPIYTASKWGVLGASRSFGGHEHYPRTGVKVIAICPGFTDTPLLKKLDEVPLAEKHLWVECEQMMMKIMKEYPMQG